METIKFKKIIVLCAIALGIGLTETAHAQTAEDSVSLVDIVSEESASNEEEGNKEQNNDSEEKEIEESLDSRDEEPEVDEEIPVTKEGLLEEDGRYFYYTNNEKRTDELIFVNEQYHYFEPAAYGGVMARNKWSYSPSSSAWFYLDEEGILQIEVRPDGYKLSGTAQYDTVVDIRGYRYYFEPEAYGGVMARNKWSYSPTQLSWYHSKENGLLDTEVTPNAYRINGQRQYDKVADIHGYRYYFEPQTYGGVMARNKWSYSPTQLSWYHAQINGVLDIEVAPNGYRINNVRQYDTIANVHGYRYYFEPQTYQGIMARNKWSYSPNTKSWYSSVQNGLIVRDVTPGGYFVNGQQQYDAIADVLGNKYYFEPKQYHGWMAVGKWSRSVRNSLWYRTDARGVIVQVDKVGPVLPKVVKLDNGSMRVFTHYNWQRLESGCHLRAVANGLNAIGVSVTPNTIWEKLPKTNDPRTGLLGNPVVSNNWDLGGAYSASYPSALMPIIKEYSEYSEDISGATMEQIKRELANGNTVQVYYAWVKPNIRLNSGNGTFYASKDYHSVLLTGYDQSGFYHLEAWGAIHNEYIAKWKLENQYNLMGKMAIVYRKGQLTAEATPIQN